MDEIMSVGFALIQFRSQTIGGIERRLWYRGTRQVMSWGRWKMGR